MLVSDTSAKIIKMNTGDPIEDYPDYIRDALIAIFDGDISTKAIGIYKLIVGICVFPIILIIRLFVK